MITAKSTTTTVTVTLGGLRLTMGGTRRNNQSGTDIGSAVARDVLAILSDAGISSWDAMAIKTVADGRTLEVSRGAGRRSELTLSSMITDLLEASAPPPATPPEKRVYTMAEAGEAWKAEVAAERADGGHKTPASPAEAELPPEPDAVAVPVRAKMFGKGKGKR